MTRRLIPQLKLELLHLERSRLLRIDPVLAVFFTLFCSCAWSQSLVIEHVTVIDATGHAAQPDRTVIVDRDRIVAVVPSKKAHIPKHAQIVDGVGKFLIPGLWDMHVHQMLALRGAIFFFSPMA